MRRGPLLLALVFVLPVSLLPASPAGPVEDAIGCDPLDTARCLLPWPNDYFATTSETDTGKRLNLNPAQMPRNIAGVPIDPTDYNRNDGFSPGSLIVTKVPGLDTPEAFANTDPVTLLDLGRYMDPDAPVVVVDAETGERHPIWVEIDRATDLEGAPPSPADTTLLMRPSVNFREGARYIVTLRNLLDADGDLIPARAAFAALRDGTGDTTRQAHYDQTIFPALGAAGIARDDLYLAWDFTVASERNLTERMLAIRDDAFGQFGDHDLDDGIVQGISPDFVVDEVTEQLPCRPEVEIDVPPVACNEQGELDARIMRRVEGRILVPCYLDLPGCPPGGRFYYALPGQTIPSRTPPNVAVAPFVCNIPAGAADGERYRPSLYGHGLFGDAGQVNSGKLYDLGAFGLAFCATDWSGMATEDVPNAISILADLSRFSTLADRVQQGMLNFLFLGRAMIHPSGFCARSAFQVDGACVFDTSELFYNGGSQGGIIGGALTAVAPDFTRAHLGVPAMNYSTLLRRSVDFDIFAEVMYRTYPDELERPLIISMIQTLWDRAESNGYAHHIVGEPLPDTPTHEVLLTPAFGDHQVTNWATDVMARTLGVSMRMPAVDPGRHPAGNNAYWGIPVIQTYPFGGSAMVVGEIGPLREVDGSTRGTTPPPVENVPNRLGVDPHGPDWSETLDAYLAIASFLSSDGWLPAVCGTAPCYLDGWSGP
ncbi:MAG TPA: hypothetical protein VGB52_07435 [Actinomycetota bacterium]